MRPDRLVLILGALVAPGAHAQAPVISQLEHYTENRGWNEAGVGPLYQTVVTARVAPADYPTLVFAERKGVRQPLTFVPYRLSPDTYAHWQRVDAESTGVWRISAERGETSAVSVATPGLANPQPVPLLREVRVTGSGTRPELRWELPDLAGFDIERIRVAVRGGKRLHGRFLDVLYVSDALAPSATAFTIPAGVLAPGERYVFQVMLEDLEDGRLENRSLTFSDPYTASR